jgi:DNA ligase 1
MSKFPKPMLAENVEHFNLLRFPKMASPKIDGIRATVHGGVLRSRSLKDIPNVHVQEKFKNIVNGIDGELIVGLPTDPDVYDKTRRVVMESGKKTNADEVNYFLFDIQQENTGFASRFSVVNNMYGENGLFKSPAGVFVVPHILVNNLEELQIFEQTMLDMGFEGVMLRDPKGPYKHGRSTEAEGWLVKVKRFTDAEARVVSCYEEMGNQNVAFTNELGRTARSASKAGKVGNNTLGGFHCVGVTGRYKDVEFDVAVSSLTHDKRKDIWDARETQVDRVLTYKYFDVGSEDKPRHPMFKGWRSAEDMSE